MGNKKQTLIIILLVVLLGLAIAYIILGPNGYTTTQKGKDFLDDVLELQSTLSYYVGASYSDAFGVYDKVEILSGKTADGEQIKDNQDNLLPTLVDLESAIDYKNDEKAYKLNMEYVETTLGIDVADYEGIEFYVVNGDILKIKLTSTPDWWSNNFDVMLLK